MASSPGDFDDDFGGDVPASNSSRHGNKRSFGDLDDEEEDIFSSKKGHGMADESAPGVATGMILSLRESLQNCQDSLALCKSELETAKAEIQKWHSAFQDDPAVPSGTLPEPSMVVSFLQNLRSSEESFREQLEKARKKEAAFIVTFAKREHEIAELKSAVRDLRAQLKPPSMQTRRLLLDPAIHEEFMRLKTLVEEKEKKVKELQDNVAAVNFTPQSKMGKMLMAKCRTLQEENEEIGMMASEGKIHDLAMKLALQRSQNSELRRLFQGMYDYMDELNEGVEKSNETVRIMHLKLEEKDSEIQWLKEQLLKKQADRNPNDYNTSQEVAVAADQVVAKIPKKEPMEE